MSASRFEEIQLHVDTCGGCQGELALLDEADDRFLRDLRQATQSGWIATDVAQTNAGPGSASTTARSNTDWVALVDPGRRLSRALAIGECKIGRFRLVERIGSGAFGYVFKAQDTELDRLVAIKIQRAGVLADKRDVDRFFQEACHAARLKHPAIVAVYDMGQTEDGVCYLVTEFIDGPTMSQRLQQGQLPLDDAVQYAIELADALEHAHRQDVIHRDIKPGNVLLDNSGHVHLTDFGLAKYVASAESMTDDGQVMGTPAYMSPEQAGGKSNRVDARSDVYGLSALLYEMLTGQPPFLESAGPLLLQVLEDEPRPLRELNAAVPRDLELICLKGLAKCPDGRYASALDLASDLRRFAVGEPTVARPLAPGQRLWRWGRRYPLAVATFMIMFLGSIAGWTYLLGLSEYFVEQTALDSVQLQSEMLERISSYYSEVVEAFHSADTSQASTAELHPGVPVPARFTIEAGKRIGECKGGMQVRLYSDYPFPWRDDGGPQDDFGRQALQKLSQNPSQPIHEFTEIDGQRVVRYAIARVMTESCLRCHNHHPESPKTDWHLGDVRGSLEVIMPLDREIRRTQTGLRGAFSWLAIGSMVTALGVAVAVIRTRGG